MCHILLSKQKHYLFSCSYTPYLCLLLNTFDDKTKYEYESLCNESYPHLAFVWLYSICMALAIVATTGPVSRTGFLAIDSCSLLMNENLHCRHFKLHSVHPLYYVSIALTLNSIIKFIHNAIIFY